MNTTPVQKGPPGPTGANGSAGVVTASGILPVTAAYNASNQSITVSIAPSSNISAGSVTAAENTLIHGAMPISGGNFTGPIGLSGNPGTPSVLSPSTGSATTGVTFTISAGANNNSSTAYKAGTLNLQGGQAVGAVGNGGDVILSGGASVNGTSGKVYYQSPSAVNYSIGGLFDGTGAFNAASGTFSGNVSTGALTATRVISTPVTLAASSNLVAVNATISNEFTLTLTSSSWTMSNPTGGLDMQKATFRLVQDATGSRTVTWGSAFNWGSGTAPALSTAANKSDYVIGIYNATTSKWDMVGQAGGF